MKRFYLIATIIGLLIPGYYLLGFFNQHGLDISRLLADSFINNGASAFTSDLLLTSIFFWPFVYMESIDKKISNWWIYLVLNLCFGLSFALPLFLYVRQGRMDESPSVQW